MGQSYAMVSLSVVQDANDVLVVFFFKGGILVNASQSFPRILSQVST